MAIMVPQHGQMLIKIEENAPLLAGIFWLESLDGKIPLIGCQSSDFKLSRELVYLIYKTCKLRCSVESTGYLLKNLPKAMKNKMEDTLFTTCNDLHNSLYTARSTLDKLNRKYIKKTDVGNVLGNLFSRPDIVKMLTFRHDRVGHHNDTDSPYYVSYLQKYRELYHITYLIGDAIDAFVKAALPEYVINLGKKNFTITLPPGSTPKIHFQILVNEFTFNFDSMYSFRGKPVIGRQNLNDVILAETEYVMREFFKQYDEVSITNSGSNSPAFLFCNARTHKWEKNCVATEKILDILYEDFGLVFNDSAMRCRQIGLFKF